MNKPLEKHLNHQVEVQEVNSGPHRAQYWCRDCKKHISWVPYRQFLRYKKIYG